MDLWDLTRLLLRRWYFAVPMLLLSVAAVVGAAMTVSPDYKALGYMQLIPAPSIGKPLDPDAKPRPANPWNDLGYAALGNAAALSVTDPTGLEKLVEEGYSDSVTVVLNERTPLFEIEAVGNSKEQATGTVQHVIKLLQDDIATKQSQYGALPEDTISTLVINDGSAPEQDTGKVKRVLIVAAGLGLLMTTASTIALDYWLRRRKLRKAGDPDDDAEAVPVPSAPPAPPAGSASVPTGAPVGTKPGAPAAAPAPAGVPESQEKTRVLLPARPAPLPRQPKSAPQKGGVYSSERRKAEAGAQAVARPANGTHPANGSHPGNGGRPNGHHNGAHPNGAHPNGAHPNGAQSANGAHEGGQATGIDSPADATVVLPASHPSRRAQDKRT